MSSPWLVTSTVKSSRHLYFVTLGCMFFCSPKLQAEEAEGELRRRGLQAWRGSPRGPRQWLRRKRWRSRHRSRTSLKWLKSSNSKACLSVSTQSFHKCEQMHVRVYYNHWIITNEICCFYSTDTVLQTLIRVKVKLDKDKVLYDVRA